jgi:eukaryotic-like serine/threonine-protein kinase
MSVPAGTQLGNLEIIRLLGAGGMGEVYLARDADLSRMVAVKVLPPEVTADPSRVARFEQEARAASALNHPNVCVIYALGRTDDGRRYIAMEYVEGETLRVRLERGRVPVGEALDITVQVATALTTAHAAGIVHRDIKPENVMVRGDRLLKVLDFGLAKLTAVDASVAAHEPTRTMHATEPGALVGTTRYMAPEQARGGVVDARTDVWALGVVLYELVTGQPPFSGETRSDVLASILEREPAPLTTVDAQLPRELQRIVGKALNKDPEERYQVMKDLMLDLKALRSELAGPSLSGTATLAGGRPRRISRGPLVLAALLVFVSAGAGIWWLTRPSDRPAMTTTVANRPLTRLTFGEALQTDPTFSPDGRFIAYASDRSGNFDVWVQPVADGDAVQITRSPAHDTQPAWSPDGRTIVFRSERDGGGLYTVPALGGIERQVASFGLYPIWTADSDHVQFRSGTAPGEGQWSMRFHQVALDGTPPRELLREFLQEGAWFWIAPHPDGRMSAWGQHRHRGQGFYTVDPGGKNVTVSRIAPGLPVAPIALGADRGRFLWHPAGTALLVQTQVSNVYNLWKIHVNPESLDWVAAERLTTGAGADVLGALSADGAKLAFGTHRESSRLWLFPLDAGGRSLGAGEPLTEDGAEAPHATFSPDGQWIGYNLMRQGTSRTETWITSLGERRSEMIATGSAFPVWSPDARSLAYVYVRTSGDRYVDTRLVVRSLEGGERAIGRTREDRQFLPTQWTKAGPLLGSYIHTTPSPVLYTSKVALWPTRRGDTAEPERVLAEHPTGPLWQPQLSPNERWLTFILQRHAGQDTVEMLIAPADGGHPEGWTRIAPDHAWPDKPRFSHDGRTLYFISRRPGTYFNVWGIGFDPEGGVAVGEPFLLSAFDSPAFYISQQLDRAEMSVSARHLALTMRSAAGSIWMLENVDR